MVAEQKRSLGPKEWIGASKSCLAFLIKRNKSGSQELKYSGGLVYVEQALATGKLRKRLSDERPDASIAGHSSKEHMAHTVWAMRATAMRASSSTAATKP